VRDLQGSVCLQVMPHTAPVGFSNDFFVAAPGHPFLQQMISALPRWNHQFGTKYPTVMFSTGPMFVSYQVRLGSPRAGLWQEHRRGQLEAPIPMVEFLCP
jgi:hypothetical protein